MHTQYYKKDKYWQLWTGCSWITTKLPKYL